MNENNEIRISVIVPVYTYHDCFETSLNSILAQKCDFRYEVLLECFGSDPKMMEIIRKYEKLYPERLFVSFCEQNYGVSASRNAGILQARGTYVTFVDNDDILNPSFLAFLGKKAEKYPSADMLSVSYFTHPHFRKLQGFRTNYHGEGKKVLFRFFNHVNLRYQVYCWARLYRKSFLDTHGIHFLSDMTIYEDWPFFAMVLYHAKEVKFFSKQLYHYVQRKGSAVHRKRDSLFYNLLAIKHIRDYLFEKDKEFAKKVFGRISRQMKIHMLIDSFVSKELYQMSVRELYSQAKKKLEDVYLGKELDYGPKKIS